MAGASPALDEGGGRKEWLRVYDRMVAILRKSHQDVKGLLADRARLEAIVKIQQEFWLHRDAVLRGRLEETQRVEECLRRGDAAELGLLLGDKDRLLRRHRIYIESQDGDLEDFKRDAAALAEENNALKIRLKEVENCAELNEQTTDHEHSGRDLRAEIRKLKKAYTALSSQKESEVYALVAEKDFVWNQFKTMEKDYEVLLKKKKMEAEQATEAAQKLQQKVEELQLQVAAQKKDDDTGRLQAEADARKKILVLEDKLQKMHFLVSEKDDEIQKLKSGHLRASQKRKQDINGTHRRSRSEGPSVQGKSKSNPRKKMVDEDQPESSQKRQCASSLSNALVLRRCSSRMVHLKPTASSSPVPQQVLFHSSFKVPKLKAPAPPLPPPPS